MTNVIDSTKQIASSVIVETTKVVDVFIQRGKDEAHASFTACPECSRREFFCDFVRQKPDSGWSEARPLTGYRRDNELSFG